ncbi:unnamed protein product [Heligmosomoides polygyrus]|uniref:Zinc transporter ZIP3 n=1 Tax=Heligmosomoides polygyrus TaxID=6339 RepID=A0A3P8E9N4_HELPZ|nr:unnamed protein product [Heligmosomoides polygyrus]
MTATLQITLAIVMFLTTAIAGFIPMKVLSGTDFEFPLPQFTTCIGFFLVYLIEEICVKVFAMKHDHGHDGEQAEKVAIPVHKESLNLRNTQALLGLSEDDDPKAAFQTHSLVMEETANYAVAESSEGSLLKSLTFAVAMSFHSILEGFALGVQNTTARIVTLFISLILHKGVEAFSVGLQISKGNSNKLKAVVATIIIYALMTPIGSGLGTLLQVLAQEKDNEHNSLKQLLAIFIGFAVIAALQLAFGEHGHGGGEEHLHVHTLPPEFLSSTTLVPH